MCLFFAGEFLGRGRFLLQRDSVSTLMKKQPTTSFTKQC